MSNFNQAQNQSTNKQAPSASANNANASKDAQNPKSQGGMKDEPTNKQNQSSDASRSGKQSY